MVISFILGPGWPVKKLNSAKNSAIQIKIIFLSKVEGGSYPFPEIAGPKNGNNHYHVAKKCRRILRKVGQSSTGPHKKAKFITS